MSSACAAEWVWITKIGHHLLRRPRAAITSLWQRHTDSVWTECPENRESSSGWAIMVGRHLIESRRRQQRAIALSWAEAETCRMAAWLAELLGIQSCAADLGMQLSAEVYAETSAALGIV